MSAAPTGPAGRSTPTNNFLYIHSHSAVYVNGLVPATPGAVRHGLRRGTGARGRRRTAREGAGGGRAAGAGAGRGGATVQGLPLLKPPYDRITAYDMNTGEIVWQKPHSSTPDDIKNHPALKGVTAAHASRGSPAARSSAC